MELEKPKSGPPGTTEQSPRWEGPEETRPRGYLPAKDDPDRERLPVPALDFGQAVVDSHDTARAAAAAPAPRSRRHSPSVHAPPAPDHRTGPQPVRSSPVPQASHR